MLRVGSTPGQRRPGRDATWQDRSSPTFAAEGVSAYMTATAKAVAVALAFALACGLASAVPNFRKYVRICLVGQGSLLLSPDRTDHFMRVALCLMAMLCNLADTFLADTSSGSRLSHAVGPPSVGASLRERLPSVWVDAEASALCRPWPNLSRARAATNSFTAPNMPRARAPVCPGLV